MHALVLALLAVAPARGQTCQCTRTTTLADRVADATTIVEGAIVGVGPMVPNLAPLEERQRTGVSEIQTFRLQVSAVLKPGPGLAEGGETEVIFQHCNTAPLTPRTGEIRIHYLRLDDTGRLTTHFCDWFKANRDTREAILAAVAAATPPAPAPAPAPAAPEAAAEVTP